MTQPLTDPTLPFFPLRIGGIEYRMCFDLGSLAEAESKLLQAGQDVNLLEALPRMNLTSLRVLFAASLHAYHPSISFDEASALVTLPALFQVADAIGRAWAASLPEPSKERPANPTQAAG